MAAPATIDGLVMVLSDLLGADVVSEDGQGLGRVHDVRARRLSRRTPDGYGLRLIALVIGRGGFRERLGIDSARTAAPTVDRDLIPWERIVSVDGPNGRVVVREGTEAVRTLEG